MYIQYMYCADVLSIGPHPVNSGNEWLLFIRPQVDKVTCNRPHTHNTKLCCVVCYYVACYYVACHYVASYYVASYYVASY